MRDAVTKSVFSFDRGKADGTHEWRDLLGGKGANLAEMTNLGVPVPPGFTIACPVCDEFLRTRAIPASVRDQVEHALERLEQATGRRLGDSRNPLLVSVRSGARVSMPGMMETILNLGLNDDTVQGLSTQSGDERFAYDSYRRFLQMFGDVVMGVPLHRFEALLSSRRVMCEVKSDSELPADVMRSLVHEYKALVRGTLGRDVPMDPRVQLWAAVEAVWDSWMLKKAVDYRRVHRISDTPGTAVNVVAMVFGNLGDDSGTGVASTRDPSTGERRFYGEFLLNAQGEDVVAGTRTPLPIAEMENRLPAAYRELIRVQELLE